MGFSQYLPYAAVFIIAMSFLVYFRQFVLNYIELKNKELKLLAVKASSENKLQAYERMTLFLERIKTANLINKFDRNLEVYEFLFLTEKAVSEEFEYNGTNSSIYQKKHGKILPQPKIILFA